MSLISPGSTIGILGGGQLGRMLALAAAELGYRCHIFSPEADCPASQVAAATTVADYDDHTALDRFAAAIHVATFEFENIPVAAIERVAARIGLHPGAEVLRITQDRLLEKQFAQSHGAETAPYAALSSDAELAAATRSIGAPSVLKTRRLGYDGKGQQIIKAPAAVAGSGALAAAMGEAWNALGRTPCVLESFVDFTCELSVVVARNAAGQLAAYVPVENRHSRHILATTIAPAQIPPPLAARAEQLARDIAAALDIVGVLAVEMFVTRDGRLLVNELAPRVHNSGHWTIEACCTSQFEQHIRAVCGLPLGAPDRHANAVMQNLIGDDIERWPAIIADPHNKLHLYGKTEARPGRKMGHVTRLFPLGTTPMLPAGT